MTLWIVLLTIVEVLCALLLVLLVLLQRSKDEGLGMAFGGAMGESLFGAQATTILTKATVILAVVFMLNTIVLDRAHSSSSRTQSGSVMDKVTGGAALPPPSAVPMPAPVADETEATVPAPDFAPAPAFNPQPVPVSVDAEQPAAPEAEAPALVPVAPAPEPETPATPAPVASPVPQT